MIHRVQPPPILMQLQPLKPSSNYYIVFSACPCSIVLNGALCCSCITTVAHCALCMFRAPKCCITANSHIVHQPCSVQISEGTTNITFVGPPSNGTFSIQFLHYFLLRLNLTYMKRILHLVPVKNIIFMSSYNWLKMGIFRLLRPLTAN